MDFATGASLRGIMLFNERKAAETIQYSRNRIFLDVELVNNFLSCTIQKIPQRRQKNADVPLNLSDAMTVIASSSPGVYVSMQSAGNFQLWYLS
jgi:hypothetical protein